MGLRGCLFVMLSNRYIFFLFDKKKKRYIFLRYQINSTWQQQANHVTEDAQNAMVCVYTGGDICEKQTTRTPKPKRYALLVKNSKTKMMFSSSHHFIKYISFMWSHFHPPPPHLHHIPIPFSDERRTSSVGTKRYHSPP